MSCVVQTGAVGRLHQLGPAASGALLFTDHAVCSSIIPEA